MPRTDMRFWDPTGAKYGLPTWPWKLGPSPDVMATGRQLKARGLRPGGHEPAGQLGWRRQGEDHFASLYRVELALPKRPMTPAKWAAVWKAIAARRICPDCGEDRGYEPSRRLGVCNDCANAGGYAAAA